MKKMQEPIEDPLSKLTQYSGKTFVIKYGGSIMKNKKAEEAFIKDVKYLRKLGINIVIVHGGGPEISRWLELSGIESRFVDGLRVTDEKVIEIVQMVLSGKINKKLSLQFNIDGVNAVGLSGVDNKLIEATKKYVYKGNETIDIGYVGKVTKVNSEFIKELLKGGQVPVIAPIGCDNKGNVYNINADYAAAFISSALDAEKLIILTDVEGVYRNINDPQSIIHEIDIKDVNYYIKEEIIKGGMIPKVQCCASAIENGTKNVQLIDGRNDHCLINDILNYRGTIISYRSGVKCQKAI
ncbi:acetylglutamate kinase [Clostridium acetobutylicum]|uniref:Acetylglutamate kinase n=1 Tax=Clostridium acetobutylicum (strain ATCC 824 / DSM 792 / JCM 1419 / IAM 19013 / LMG 5710 / NBRC 13948 / NRRL B-527 / VKM B-1787 / 2291 / W) TaxID=272562 RepID=ARGB_CLOAB|nr:MULTISPECIES: acetylglutamate kinase [Clostridium]Q97GH8.1 RecName: Full=Acetylglutamate kinase; AltName: Full=N-acetyl-L-glutamate 5-phosphotransferase; AltName: Full=NAG kinase; Short=NAGK [Clostridium acetobutylicum ATCC 824]AAK80344.1 Acetylglutamate kinase [Clostridium acetobutylicum ATCC 824]ADZ21441.1 Acetylglutamate kinase [Clostridium acetobutylicum EA 2018]AEI33670.1 acetylglutamate kinase [Clostridium acetobutylicum DSM 1731]AWV79235.1 acetylglutamate kinase [Clostridium acetobut